MATINIITRYTIIRIIVNAVCGSAMIYSRQYQFKQCRGCIMQMVLHIARKPLDVNKDQTVNLQPIRL